LLVWDIERAPKVTRYADRVLNPLVGKSLVVYLDKPPAPAVASVPLETGARADTRRAPSSGPAMATGASLASEGAVA